MNIKVHTTLTLAACTATGVALGSFLVDRFRGIDDRIRELGPASVAMRNVELFGESLGQWLLVNDLVLYQGETFMASSSLTQADRLQELLDDIGETPLVADQRPALLRLADDIEQTRELIDQARDLRGEQRDSRLAALASEADRLGKSAVARIEDLQHRMRRRAGFLSADLNDQRRFLALLSLAAAVLYLGVVALCWLWTVHKIVAPIEGLSDAAERAARDDAEFELSQRGPDEVRLLTRNIGSFVDKLQSAKAHTEQQVKERTAQLVEANQAKAQFLATMSHELRTPLNGIINMNELILETPLDREQESFARTAKNAAEALLGLINDILDFSKIEARKLTLELVEVDLRQLTDGAVEILAGLADSKGLELHAVVAPSVPAKVQGDPTRLRQVLINFLNNALKFTAEGSVSIHVDVDSTDEANDGTTLRFEVRDTGIGIPPERRASLFTAFEQVDASTTRKYGGTGLGLAICKELSALMGGDIGVDSEVGRGSTFWFTARLGTVPQQAPPPAPADSVLVVSRRPLVRARLEAQLRFLGVPASRCQVVEHWQQGTEPQTGQALAIVDPYATLAEPFEAVEQLRGVPWIDGQRIAVLDHWLRHWPAEMGTPPTGIHPLAEPTGFEQLRAWLDGAPATASASNRPVPSTGTADAAGTGRHILVAEDTTVNQQVVRTVLERAGHRVTITENGREALDAFAEQTFDLVLMDCQMPVMDGIEATRKIRALETDRAAASTLPRHVPILALTANAREEVVAECRAAGVDEFMTKPFRPADLLAAVERLLEPVPAAEPAAESAATDAPLILVADDSQINRTVASSVLRRAGYQVALVEDGQQAVEFIAETGAALVLMDCQMPVLDGLQATRLIRELEAAGPVGGHAGDRLPIVALTGNAQESDRQEALAAGMDDFVTKPFRPKGLLAVVERWCRAAAPLT